MSQKIGFGWRNWGKYRRQAIGFCGYFLMALLCILGSPVWAGMGTSGVDVVAVVRQGRGLYDAGRFTEAVQVLERAVREYKQQGNEMASAVTLSNLALSYQELGDWNAAKQAIAESLNLLRKSSQNRLIYAQSLDIYGRLQLAMGQAEAALMTWQEAGEIYQKLDNVDGLVKALINQAQAWRSQGFYRRAVAILRDVNQRLRSQPDTLTKAVSLRSLGDALLVVGSLEESRTTLEASLLIAQRLQADADIAASLLSLGNHARLCKQTSPAIAYYQKAIAAAPTMLTKVQAQLRIFKILVAEDKLAVVPNLIPSIQTQLEQLPLSRGAIYAQIHFAQSLKKAKTNNLQPAKLLAMAIQQAQSLGDQQAEANATWNLGSLYEQTKQWQQARQLTQKALLLAQTSNAIDLIYPISWQLGRVLWAENEITGAIAAYDGAIETLQFLRKDLVAINKDLQFNFRDDVEPVYRQSVELLLQYQAQKPNPETLDKVRQRIEALQLAELDNFFQEACLLGKSVPLDLVVDKENPQTAIIYPIILPTHIQVIVKIPYQPLQDYRIPIPQATVEKKLAQMRKLLVNPAAKKAAQTELQQVYQWLIQPFEAQLQAKRVNNLVFILDGSFRNLPMAALYDGKQYLVEKYAIALSVGLQLLKPKPLVNQEIKALTAGLTRPPAGFPNVSFLPAIQSEVNLINQSVVLNRTLIDQEFTHKALETQVNAATFNVVHLATHGEFSSEAEKTFVLADDGPINVKQFDTLLRDRDTAKPKPLELLFLSACQTAAGDNRATLGLAGAAVKAGARSTVASLWHIDDQSTALLVGAFYHNLKSSQITKAEALRQAQIKLIKHPNYKAPSFWSAYVLIGNWL